MKAKIASPSKVTYPPAMVATRLVRMLTVLALLLAPLGISGHAAMAMPSAASATMQHSDQAMAADHCAGMARNSDGQSERQTSPSIDCTIACSCLPAASAEIGAHAAAVAMVEPMALVTGLSGLHPESDPPPPRLA